MFCEKKTGLALLQNARDIVLTQTNLFPTTFQEPITAYSNHLCRDVASEFLAGKKLKDDLHRDGMQCRHSWWTVQHAWIPLRYFSVQYSSYRSVLNSRANPALNIAKIITCCSSSLHGIKKFPSLFQTRSSSSKQLRPPFHSPFYCMIFIQNRLVQIFYWANDLVFASIGRAEGIFLSDIKANPSREHILETLVSMTFLAEQRILNQSRRFPQRGMASAPSCFAANVLSDKLFVRIG